MTREMILTRIANGESVSAEEVATLRNFEELEALNREAARRQQEQTAQRQAQESRSALINELVALDKAAESAARYFNDVSERRTKETRKLDELELEARTEWYQAYRMFDAQFREVYKLNPGELFLPEVKACFDELRAKGAKVDNVILNASKLPLSHSMNLLVSEMPINDNFNTER